MNGWVSFKKQLPPLNEYVLGWSSKKREPFFIRMVKYKWSAGNTKTYIQGRDIVCMYEVGKEEDDYIYKFTYWHPLPGSPRQRKKIEEETQNAETADRP